MYRFGVGLSSGYNGCVLVAYGRLDGQKLYCAVLYPQLCEVFFFSLCSAVAEGYLMTQLRWGGVGADHDPAEVGVLDRTLTQLWTSGGVRGIPPLVTDTDLLWGDEVQSQG